MLPKGRNVHAEVIAALHHVTQAKNTTKEIDLIVENLLPTLVAVTENRL
jgi:hypothetical protein